MLPRGVPPPGGQTPRSHRAARARIGPLRLLGGGAAALLSCLAIARVFAATPPEPLVADFDSKHQQTCISVGCHSVDLVGTGVRHLPYLEGRCMACHTDHASSSPGLLKEGGDRLCLTCHTEITLEAETSRMAHPKTEDSCVSCHDPHESRILHLLKNEELLLGCASCHSDFLQQSHDQPFRHDFFDPEKQCGACHYAHSRGEKKHLREDVSESCLTCHSLGIQIEGRRLENVGRQMREATYVHEAMKGGESCPTCHTPHGSVQASLLLAGYPAGSYSSYSHDNYNLCWQCHDPGLVENSQPRGVTQFRVGDETNLHRVHVLELRRGRACHVCHTGHSGEVPHLLRTEITFQQWNAPLRFESLPDGGRCETPCHRPMEYRRGQTAGN